MIPSQCASVSSTSFLTRNFVWKSERRFWGFGEFCAVSHGFWFFILGICGMVFSPLISRWWVIPPESWPRIRMAAAVESSTEEARKGVLRPFVANSSALLGSHSRLLLSFFGSLIRESGSHNPEVVGSNPAPATRKNT